MPPKDPCQKQACAIQKCLQASGYVEGRCEDVIRAMKKCCEIHSAEKSVCCSGFPQEHKTDNKRASEKLECKKCIECQGPVLHRNPMNVN